MARRTSKKAIDRNDVEKKVRTIQRKTCKRYDSEDKIRIVLEGLRGEGAVAELSRRSQHRQATGEAVALRGKFSFTLGYQMSHNI